MLRIDPHYTIRKRRKPRVPSNILSMSNIYLKVFAELACRRGRDSRAGMQPAGSSCVRVVGPLTENTLIGNGRMGQNFACGWPCRPASSCDSRRTYSAEVGSPVPGAAAPPTVSNHNTGRPVASHN